MGLVVVGIEAAIAGITRDARERHEKAGQVVRRTAESVEYTMKQVAPKLSGETAASITHDVRSSAESHTAMIGPTNRDPKGRPVGQFIEFGTSDTAPQPFVGPTAEFYRQQFYSDLKGV